MFAKIRSPLVESSKLNACEIRDILLTPRSSYYIATLANDIPLAAPLLKCFAQSNIRVDVEVVVAVANNNDFVDLFALRRDFGLQRGERIRRWRCLSTSSLSKVRSLTLRSYEFTETVLKNPEEFLSD